MPIATMSSKGQITIPIEIREKYRLHPGTRVHFVIKDDETFEAIPATRSIKDLAGFLQYDGPSISLEDMDDGIAAAAADSMNR
jgi:antitoxin PrlF